LLGTRRLDRQLVVQVLFDRFRLRRIVALCRRLLRRLFCDLLDCLLDGLLHRLLSLDDFLAFRLLFRLFSSRGRVFGGGSVSRRLRLDSRFYGSGCLSGLGPLRGVLVRTIFGCGHGRTILLKACAADSLKASERSANGFPKSGETLVGNSRKCRRGIEGLLNRADRLRSLGSLKLIKL